MMPNGQYSQCKSLVEKLRSRKAIQSRFFLHRFSVVAKRRCGYTKIGWDQYMVCYFTNSDFHDCHVMYSMLDILGELAKIIRLHGYMLMTVQVIAYFQQKWLVLNLTNDESPNLVNNRQRCPFICFNQFIVAAFVVIDQSPVISLLQTNEKL